MFFQIAFAKINFAFANFRSEGVKGEYFASLHNFLMKHRRLGRGDRSEGSLGDLQE